MWSGTDFKLMQDLAKLKFCMEKKLEKKKREAEQEQRVDREALEKSFAARLAGVKEGQSKELEVAVMEAKNEANRTISELNRVVVTERAKLLAEQQENSRQLEEEWKMKEERLQHSLVEVEERENRWQVNILILMRNWLWKADKTKEVLYIDIDI